MKNNLSQSKPTPLPYLPLIACAVLGLAVRLVAAEPQLLWQIGALDTNNADFALAPGRYSECREDAFYIAGRSNPNADWPYVHPGPADTWAGSRPHVFTIIFGLKQAAPAGECKLLLDLLDTHATLSPKLRIVINGSTFGGKLPPGGGDASIHGEPAQGKPSQLVLHFPSSALLAGANRIEIYNTAGSWLLYDRVALEAPAGTESEPVTDAATLREAGAEPGLVEQQGQLCQPITASLFYLGAPQEAALCLDGKLLRNVQLKPGTQRLEAFAAPVSKETASSLTLTAGGKVLATQAVLLKPARQWVVYILMHSHNDVGYTDVQPNIAKKQAHNVARALELIRQTKDYPVGARFKWNLEVLLPAEDFLSTATPEQRQQFEQAVHDGDIGVDAMYGNLLTGVCRSEELLRQFSFAVALGRRCGVTVDSMMISDVPGLTWGIVPALAQNGVKYISDGPNASQSMEGDRIGYVRVEWEHKPFYWRSPSGREKALYWGAQGGYNFGHGQPSLTHGLPILLQRLEEEHYPYDLVQLRWTKGDNGPPDESVMDAVRDWNAKHAFPKLIIATTSEAFQALEQRYGAKLPSYRGDFTPYWEDGAGSGARETALNRHSADRLLQAETLWALLDPARFPAAAFADAWKNVALWSEHTWGAHNSVSEPDKQFVMDQWKFKQAYALDADKQSRALCDQALAQRRGASVPGAVDVFNTASWPRTDLVTLPRETTGNAVMDDRGRPVPAQRLATGELVFLACDIPPFSGRRFVIGQGSPRGGKAHAAGAVLSTPELTVKLDQTNGAIVSLRQAGLGAELVNGQLNNYVYLPGGNARDAQPNGPATITVQEAGPLVASLRVESTAPGCHKLVREVRVVDGLDRVELVDLVDKQAVRAVEGVHFGFSFNVPQPEVRINSPGAVVRPELDQLAGACKNWFSVERWVDVSNPRYGVTWVTADAPLVELGGLTANLPRSQSNPNAYLKTIKPSATLYSWVMNNHWHTNYRAEQEGPTAFRFAIHPHREYRAADAMRFGVESTEPLIAVPAVGPAPLAVPVRIEPTGVLATAFKPADDGKAWIIRLFNASADPQVGSLVWTKPVPRVWLSDASEQALQPVGRSITLPPWGLVTVRADQQ